MPMAEVGYTALSVDKQTTFCTRFWMAASNRFSLPLMLVFTASIGKLSQDGTCFIAAAWKTKSTPYMAASIDLLSRIRLKKWHYAVGVLLILSLIFGQDVYRNIIFRFYPYYKDSMFDNGQLSYVNIAKCLAVLILCLIYWKDSVQENRRNRYYFYLNLAGLVLYSCGSFIPEVSRVAYYLIQSQIFLIPGVLKDAKKGWFRTLCIIGVVAAYLLYFVMLLRGMYDVEIRLLPYLNWIFN